MARDPLAHRRERVPGQFLEHVVQPVNRFFRECPGHRRLLACDAGDAIDREHERDTGDDRLHEHRSGSADEGRHTEQIAGADVAHGDLTAVAGVHIHTKQAVQDHSQADGVRFSVDGMPRGIFRDASLVDQ